MKLPLIDKALSAVHFLNGTGVSRRNISYQGISSADMATLRRVTVRRDDEDMAVRAIYETVCERSERIPLRL